MSVWQAALLGIVQGITEFLPVSSDGHLAIFQLFFDIPNDLVFNVFVHLATLIAVIIFFWKDLLGLRMKQWMWLAVGTIPAAIVGVLASDLIEMSANYLWFVALGFLVTGVANMISQRLLARDNTQIWPKLGQTVLIGIAQASALLPGVSRSGMTVATGLSTGLTRSSAFRFSFLLLIPATIGAVGFESIKLIASDQPTPSILPIVVGMLTAFVSGFYSLKLLQKMIANAKIGVFGIYCLVLGSALLLVSVFLQ